MYEELCLFKDSQRKISSAHLVSGFWYKYSNIIHGEVQISDKSHTFGSESTLQRKKHYTSKYCHTLEKQRKQLSKSHKNWILYLCNKIQFIEPDIVCFQDPHKKYSDTKWIKCKYATFSPKIL